MKMSISIIIPTLNEEYNIQSQLEAINACRTKDVEIIVADGGSVDRTVEIATPRANHVVVAPRGRASQMNAGAQLSQSEILLFLHADTVLPSSAVASMESALALSTRVWGRFDVRIVPSSSILSAVAWAMNLRSRLSGIATGDQAIFVRRSAFLAVQGFPDIPLMEDIALSKALKRLSRPICLRQKVSTSARRWQSHGVVRTIFFMWRLRLEYFLGADPRKLAMRYGYAPRNS